MIPTQGDLTTQAQPLPEPANTPAFQDPPPSSPIAAAPATPSDPKAGEAWRLLSALWPTENRAHLAAYRNRAGKFRNAPVANAAKAVAEALAASARGDDTYFALAEYTNAETRTAANAASVCAFWVDIDCGAEKAAQRTGYATKEEGREAVDKFIQDADLPWPTYIVDSGSGWHIYWCLDKPIDAAAWRELALKFKALTKRLGLLADPTRTADIASVLRIPGTLNHKYQPPKPVILVEVSDTLIETAVMRLAIEVMHSQVCGILTPAVPVFAPSTPGTVRAITGPINIATLRSAMAVLDPDCDDGEWKLHRMAPLALAAREHPAQADDLKQAAMDFSSGALRGRASSKWCTPGASNGLTGEQVFEGQWNRFITQPHHGKPVTIATIFADAIKAGWMDPTEDFTVVPDETIAGAADDAMDLSEDHQACATVSQSVRLTATSFPDQPPESIGPLPATLPNLRHMLARYGIVVRYDVIKKKIRITVPRHQGSPDNAGNTALTKIISLAIFNGLSSGQVAAYVDAIADENLYNPAADWILSKPWDGTDRLTAMYATLQTREGFPVKLKEALVYRWLLSAVAAALMPSGFKGRGVLTLQGPQGIGKTSWVMALIDDPALRDMLVKVDHHLDPSLKDSILGAISHWIVEIGELDSSFRKDMARLKGVLTSDADKIRRPYARTESEYQRRTVFMATVNETNFLVDHTGNSRWWTLPVVKVNFKHGIDVQQLFAQLAVDFERGAHWWLTPEEDALLAQRNERHRSTSAVEEMLLAKLDLHPQEGTDKTKMTALDVLKAAGIDKPSNPQCKECNSFLRSKVGEPRRIKGLNYWWVAFHEPSMDSTGPEGADQDSAEDEG